MNKKKDLATRSPGVIHVWTVVGSFVRSLSHVINRLCYSNPFFLVHTFEKVSFVDMAACLIMCCNVKIEKKNS